MKVKGNEPPIAGYTDEDAFKWCIESHRGLPARAQKARRRRSRSRTTGA